MYVSIVQYRNGCFNAYQETETTNTVVNGDKDDRLALIDGALNPWRAIIHVVPAKLETTTVDPEEDWELVSCLGAGWSVDIQVETVLTGIQDLLDEWKVEQLTQSCSWDCILHGGGEEELWTTVERIRIILPQDCDEHTSFHWLAP